MITVGYQKETHTHKRNIIGIIDGIRYRKVKSYVDYEYMILRLMDKLGIKLFKERMLRKSAEFQDFGINKVDILHFFNTISFGKTPWIVTCGTLVPRYQRVMASKRGNQPSFDGLRNSERIYNAVRAIAGSSCKKFIAQSQCSKKLQESFLDEFPEFKNHIMEKMVVLYPPQIPIIKSIDEKNPSLRKIELIFVGSSFFRKGGTEIINVIKRNRHFKNRFNLILVSNLAAEDFVKYISHQDVRQVRKTIEENSDWIEIYPGLPNNEVLRLMKRAHVGLLPTYADAFGYSVLEFQAAGCPVISTDVRALPEINNNEIGWLINVSKNRYSEAVYGTEDQRRALRSQIETGLERVFSELCDNPDVIYDKSLQSYNHVSRLCSMESYARRLEEIYVASL